MRAIRRCRTPWLRQAKAGEVVICLQAFWALTELILGICLLWWRGLGLLRQAEWVASTVRDDIWDPRSYVPCCDRFVIPLLAGSDDDRGRAYRTLRGRLAIMLKTREGIEDSESPVIYASIKERLFISNAAGEDVISAGLAERMAASGLFDWWCSWDYNKPL